MAGTYEARSVGVSIERDWREVYSFAAIPLNFQRWASGLGGSLKQDASGRWTAQGPEGPIGVRFSERNELGVLDHWVSLSPGVELYIPLRILANGSGSEVVLTVFRLPGVTDEKLAADIAWVERDLQALKALLEA